MNRVVSLLPSSTEIIHALGCGDRIVGRSHECDYPAGIAELPPCTAPKFDPNGTSKEIDERVKAVLEEAVSVYRVDTALLDELAPDLGYHAIPMRIVRRELTRRSGGRSRTGALKTGRSLARTQ